MKTDKIRDSAFNPEKTKEPRGNHRRWRKPVNLKETSQLGKNPSRTFKGGKRMQRIQGKTENQNGKPRSQGESRERGGNWRPQMTLDNPEARTCRKPSNLKKTR